MSETFGERVVRLRERTSKPGWKGPKSVPVAVETWEEALEVVGAFRAHRSGELPFLSCSGDGTIFLRWGERPGLVIDVEIVPAERKGARFFPQLVLEDDERELETLPTNRRSPHEHESPAASVCAGTELHEGGTNKH